MREQLIQYVDLLFAGVRDCEDIKQEILQNTLDRYDDLIAEGKVPEAAYRLAITGIGDINEILGTKSQIVPAYQETVTAKEAVTDDNIVKKLLRAVAIALYILCPIPLFILSDFGMDTIGLCGTLAIVAVATVLIILGGRKQRKAQREDEAPRTPQSELSKSVGGAIWAIGLAVYFILSFITNAWHITWVVFLITGAVQNLAKAFLDSRAAGTDTAYYRTESSSKTGLRKSVGSLIRAIGIAVYFLVSFATNAWYITWVLFPIIGAVQGLAGAIIDLKEAMNNEE